MEENFGYCGAIMYHLLILKKFLRAKVRLLRIFTIALSVFALQTPTALADGAFVGSSDSDTKLAIKWQWSDGASKNRTISNSRYRSAEKFPFLIVTVPPRRSTRIVSIEALWTNANGGESIWKEENWAQTINGVVRIQPYPYCAENRDCTGVHTYRILVQPSGDAPQYKPAIFKVTWKASSGGGSSSGSSGGGSTGSFIGWNLEDVQEYLGYDPRTYDCSGSYRSVWWSSNWWVVGYSGSSLIVSKSRGYCS